MEPERTSPYWDAIVGDDWPEVSPAHWNALETRARAAASALNTGDAPQARLAFDQAVRASERLQPIKDEMLAQQGMPQAFADALLAASEVFRGFGDLVYRTRNRILDIVDDATARSRQCAAGPKAMTVPKVPTARRTGPRRKRPKRRLPPSSRPRAMTCAMWSPRRWPR